EREDDFTSDKSTEHMSYVKNLNTLRKIRKNVNKSNSVFPAEYALVGDSGVRPSLSIKVRPGFYDAIEQYEKTSEDVNSFWLSIDMKKQLDIKKVSVVFSINSLCFRLTDLEYEIVAVRRKCTRCGRQ
ncbi:4686_t:CDS:2, partial [Entrophospora sp. SA101]